MNTPDIQFTVQDIYELHIQLEETFILSSGIRDENLLASAVNTPFQTFMGNDLYPSIYDKAAQLFMVSPIIIPLQTVINELHSTVCMCILLSMVLILPLHNKTLKI